jgi:hypothetical protein
VRSGETLYKVLDWIVSFLYMHGSAWRLQFQLPVRDCDLNHIVPV